MRARTILAAVLMNVTFSLAQESELAAALALPDQAQNPRNDADYQRAVTGLRRQSSSTTIPEYTT
jgi:hypothetical protein